MDNSKTFAFRLANRAVSPKSNWKARSGSPIAGCSEVQNSDYRYIGSRGADNGWYC